MAGLRGAHRFRGMCALVLAGCAGADPAAVACGGQQPALEDCASLGVYSADCGGDGGPTFACDPSLGTCRWFAGQCVAEGYRASDCPASDPCCHVTPDGSWPFADGMTEAPGAPNEIVEDIAVIGATPMDAEGPLNLTVTIDPAFVAPDLPDVTCTGETATTMFGGSLCMEGRLLVARVLRVHDSLALEITPSVFGRTLLLEILPSADGAVGRAFVAYQNDFRATPVAHCDDGIPGLGLAPSTTLVVNGLDEASLHGRVEVTFVDGSIAVAF